MKKKKLKLDYKTLTSLISDGDLETALDQLLEFIEGVETIMTTEIYHASSRFRKLKAEKMRGKLTNEDYLTEFNSITYSILEIINSLKKFNLKKLGVQTSEDEILLEIEELAKEFEQTNTMTSQLAQLRMKIYLARKIADKMILWPGLADKFKNSKEEAIICAIGRKVKVIPDIEDLQILESVTPNATTNLSKAFIINAVAELLYSGQSRIGDDIRIKAMLKDLNLPDNLYLQKNSEMVMALLGFLTGQMALDKL